MSYQCVNHAAEIKVHFDQDILAMQINRTESWNLELLSHQEKAYRKVGATASQAFRIFGDRTLRLWMQGEESLPVKSELELIAKRA